MIDHNPQVGRIIFQESMVSLFELYGPRLGIITRISGSRIYYNNRITKREMFVMKYGVICDTEEEVDKLKKFRSKCLLEIYTLGKEHRKKFEKEFLMKEKNEAS